MKDEAAYAENFLGKYAKSTNLEGAPSDLNSLLSYVSKTYRERCFMMLITDADGISRVEPDLLRKLHARNEIMVIVVEDSPLTNQLLTSSDTVEIEGKLRLSQYLRKNKRLSKAEKAYRDAQRVGIRKSLRRMGIVCCFVDSVDHAIPRIVTMLEEQKHVRK